MINSIACHSFSLSLLLPLSSHLSLLVRLSLAVGSPIPQESPTLPFGCFCFAFGTRSSGPAPRFLEVSPGPIGPGPGLLLPRFSPLRVKAVPFFVARTALSMASSTSTVFCPEDHDGVVKAASLIRNHIETPEARPLSKLFVLDGTSALSRLCFPRSVTSIIAQWGSRLDPDVRQSRYISRRCRRADDFNARVSVPSTPPERNNFLLTLNIQLQGPLNAQSVFQHSIGCISNRNYSDQFHFRSSETLHSFFFNFRIKKQTLNITVLK